MTTSIQERAQRNPQQSVVDQIARGMASRALAAEAGYEAAWTPYTPTVTPGSGAFTTVSAVGAYMRIGKTVFFRLSVTITTNGTAANSVRATLPFAAAATAGPQVANGQETNVLGFGLACSIQTSGTVAIIQKYDGGYPGANGHILAVSGTYEMA